MKRNFRIALVEDDADQRKLTTEMIGRHLSDLSLVEIVSEEHFRSALGRGELADCDVIIMDVMLPWTSLDAFVPMPRDYDGYYEAGLRCIRELRLSDRGRSIPIIIYTLLESQDISEHLKKMDLVVCVNKSQPEQLLRQLRGLALAQNGDQSAPH
ncbi:hypothetical protein SBA4_3340006 [Candidatus Sulfopaludibacter sp. SbA4]|nr:hypothetical protein SBA4_3340006 [Candidatus Sulfopaludibacter sp. SbA4]